MNELLKLAKATSYFIERLIDEAREAMKEPEKLNSIPRLDPSNGYRFWIKDILYEKLSESLVVTITDAEGNVRTIAAHEFAEWVRADD